MFENHTVFDNLELALAGQRSVFASLFFRLSREQRDRIDDVLETVSLTAQRDRLAGALSHGQKQWLEIGMLLMQDPELLLVDEPAAGMTDAETEADGGAAEGDRQEPLGGGGRARHGVRPRARLPRHRAARRLGAGRRARWTRCRRTSEVIEVYLGRMKPC